MVGPRYECNSRDCNYTGQHGQLVEHYIRAHVTCAQAPWSCSLCGFRATSRPMLVSHEGHFIHKSALKRNIGKGTQTQYIKSKNPYRVRTGIDIIRIDFPEAGPDQPYPGMWNDHVQNLFDEREPHYDMNGPPDMPVYDHSASGERFKSRGGRLGNEYYNRRDDYEFDMRNRLNSIASYRRSEMRNQDRYGPRSGRSMKVKDEEDMHKDDLRSGVYEEGEDSALGRRGVYEEMDDSALGRGGVYEEMDDSALGRGGVYEEVDDSALGRGGVYEEMDDSALGRGRVYEEVDDSALGRGGVYEEVDDNALGRGGVYEEVDDSALEGALSESFQLAQCETSMPAPGIGSSQRASAPAAESSKTSKKLRHNSRESVRRRSVEKKDLAVEAPVPSQELDQADSAGGNKLTPERVPVSSSTTLKPASSSTTLKPASSNTTLKPASSSTTHKPASSSTTLKPASSSTTLKPASSSTTLKPASFSTNQKPGSSSTSQKPVISSTNQKPASSSTSQKPVISSTKQKPASSSTTTSQKPVNSSTKQKPASSSTSQKPVISGTKQKPASSSTSQKPVISGIKQKPASSSTKQKPASSGTSQKPVGKEPDNVPESSSPVIPDRPVRKPSQDALHPHSEGKNISSARKRRRSSKSVDQSSEVGSTCSSKDKEKASPATSSDCKKVKMNERIESKKRPRLEQTTIPCEDMEEDDGVVHERDIQEHDVHEHDVREHDVHDEDEDFESRLLEEKVSELLQALDPLKNISKALIALDHHMRRLLPIIEVIAKAMPSGNQ